MTRIYKHEMKLLFKSFLIWTLSVAGMCFACILLFRSLKGEMENVAESFSDMGMFSAAFGMDQLNMATLEGYYATNIGVMHSLGAAMFAVMISIVMLSKEEDGHTGEFLFTLPLSRAKIITAKLLAVITNVVVFNVCCVALYFIGFLILGEEIQYDRFFLYHGLQLLAHLEMVGICFGISAFVRKNKPGIGLGIALMFYAYDLIARVIPDLSDYKFISPFAFANAGDIFSTGEIAIGALVLGMLIMIAGVTVSYVTYARRDLQA